VPIFNNYNFSLAPKIYYNAPTSPGANPATQNDTVGGAYSTTGSLGFSGGMEFYLNKNYYLSGTFGYYPRSAFYLYSFASWDYRYMSLCINKKINKLHLGAGLGWSKYYYANDPGAENSDPYGYFNSHGYTLRLEAQYQIGNNWYLATNIQPIIASDKTNGDKNFTFWGVEINYKIPLAIQSRVF
jgi:hypothetical protein